MQLSQLLSDSIITITINLIQWATKIITRNNILKYLKCPLDWFNKLFSTLATNMTIMQTLDQTTEISLSDIYLQSKQTNKLTFFGQEFPNACAFPRVHFISFLKTKHLPI